MATSNGSARTGVWLIGARGGLATTLVVGVSMIRRGLVSPGGLLSETDLLSREQLPPLDSLVFGGHDIRDGSVYQSALEIYRDTGTIPYDKLEIIKGELSATDAEIRPGSAHNCGTAIARLASRAARARETRPAAIVERFRRDIESFRDRHGLQTVIVVNLASTEPPLALRAEHRDADALRSSLRRGRGANVRASTLYAFAAIDGGFPFINFTPSNAALIPALQQLGSERNVPFMGNDGKTGETLVKSALAPMFKYRSLRVLSWQGYNILGDRDGLILSDDRNKQSKIQTKDSVLASILGYPLHTHVGIDYVPSLSDLKTAWDFIHFQGFLDYKMSLQFTWQGCDAILAAPLVLDLARFAALAHRRGEGGPLRHLACFFKDPIGVEEQDLHCQFNNLLGYFAKPGKRAAGPGRKGRRRRAARSTS